jgi:hypothetical protein
MIKKRGKVMKIFKDYEVFILFVFYELRTIKGDALSELVKCYLLKSISKLKFPEKSDISGPLLFLMKIPEAFATHVRPPNPDMSRSLLFLSLSGLIQVRSRVPVTFTEHV